MLYNMRRLPEPICHASGCPRQATHAVYSSTNDRMGEFCEPHAEAWLDRLNSGEPNDKPASPRWARRR